MSIKTGDGSSSTRKYLSNMTNWLGSRPPTRHESCDQFTSNSCCKACYTSFLLTVGSWGTRFDKIFMSFFICSILRDLHCRWVNSTSYLATNTAVISSVRDIDFFTDIWYPDIIELIISDTNIDRYQPIPSLIACSTNMQSTVINSGEILKKDFSAIPIFSNILLWKRLWAENFGRLIISDSPDIITIIPMISMVPPTTDRVLAIGPLLGLKAAPSWLSRGPPSWLLVMEGSSMADSWKAWCGGPELEGGSRVWYGPEGESWGRWGGSTWSGRVGGVIGGMLKSSSPRGPTGNDWWGGEGGRRGFRTPSEQLSISLFASSVSSSVFSVTSSAHLIACFVLRSPSGVRTGGRTLSDPH